MLNETCQGDKVSTLELKADGNRLGIKGISVMIDQPRDSYIGSIAKLALNLQENGYTTSSMMAAEFGSVLGKLQIERGACKTE